ncbi:hypothetical protein DFO55_11812 [Grimontella sp. AG753]|nr:hypothetical protein DFO55_11812 [Grimontella sp. AG753]
MKKMLPGRDVQMNTHKIPKCITSGFNPFLIWVVSIVIFFITVRFCPFWCRFPAFILMMFGGILLVETMPFGSLNADSCQSISQKSEPSCLQTNQNKPVVRERAGKPLKNSNSRCFKRIIRAHAKWSAGVPPYSLFRIPTPLLFICFLFSGLFSVFEGQLLTGILLGLCTVPVFCWQWMQNWEDNLEKELLRYQPADINAFIQFQSDVLVDGKLTLNRLEKWIEQERQATGESYLPEADSVPAFTRRKVGPSQDDMSNTPR